jgi:hypothetical protein
MRFIIMHKTNAHWEAGAIPGPELIARVGELLGALSKSGALEDAAGLRASSQGVRLRFERGVRTVVKGPFAGSHELPAGFSIVRARSLDDAVEWATREAGIVGDGEIDIRPVTEPWDIGLAEAPTDASTRRYMLLRKATSATEAGDAPTPAQRAALARLNDDTPAAIQHLAAETLRPSRRGRRYRNSRDGVTVHDGPFTETKELIAGYVIVSAASLDAAAAWAARYRAVVEADEVDLRELE